MKIWKYLRKGKNSRPSVDSANCFRLFSEIQHFSSELTESVCLSPLVNITICGNLGFLTYFIIACTLGCSKILTNGLKKSFLNSCICQPARYDLFLYPASAKRAGPKGLCAESARAVTGRQCPHVGNEPSLWGLQTGRWQNLGSHGKKTDFRAENRLFGPKKTYTSWCKPCSSHNLKYPNFEVKIAHFRP